MSSTDLVPLKQQALQAQAPLDKQKFVAAMEKRGQSAVLAIADFSYRVERLDVSTTTSSANRQIAGVESTLARVVNPTWWDKLWDNVVDLTASRVHALNRSIPQLQGLKDECIRQEALLTSELGTIKTTLESLHSEIEAFKKLHAEVKKHDTDRAFEIHQHQQHLITSYTIGMQGYATVEIMLESLRASIRSIDRIYTNTLAALRISHQAAAMIE